MGERRPRLAAGIAQMAWSAQIPFRDLASPPTWLVLVTLLGNLPRK